MKKDIAPTSIDIIGRIRNTELKRYFIDLFQLIYQTRCRIYIANSIGATVTDDVQLWTEMDRHTSAMYSKALTLKSTDTYNAVELCVNEYEDAIGAWNAFYTDPTILIYVDQRWKHVLYIVQGTMSIWGSYLGDRPLSPPPDHTLRGILNCPDKEAIVDKIGSYLGDKPTGLRVYYAHQALCYKLKYLTTVELSDFRERLVTTFDTTIPTRQGISKYQGSGNSHLVDKTKIDEAVLAITK